MWHSATAAAVALIQYHLLVDAFGGLGGVIVVIVGGIVSAIAIRNARRSAAPPAAHPQPAPPSRRREPPVSFGEPAPPTIPSRRLHPGPISPRPTPEAAPQRPSSLAPDDGEPASSLFNPDIFDSPAAPLDPTSDATAGVQAPRAELPLLGATDSHDATWRAQTRRAAPTHAATVPLWNQPLLTRPDADKTASVQAVPARFSAASLPLWGDGAPLAYAAGNVPEAGAGSAVAPTALAARAPVWDLSRGSTGGEADAEVGPHASVSSFSAEPPIWLSSPRHTSG